MPDFAVAKTLNVLGLFNPVDCRSLGVIKEVIEPMAEGAVLEVQGNHFQQREIRAWAKKFAHAIIHEEDDEGLVKMFLKRGPITS